MAEVIDIRNQLSMEDTIKSVSEVALKGLEYYVKLKGQETRIDATQALKVAGAAVKSLDWKESTDEDFDNANRAVELLQSPDLLKMLSPANKESLKLAVELNNKKIMQERNLKVRADGERVKMEGYWDELEALKSSPLGESQYDITESLKVLEGIRAVNESNIGEVGKLLTEETAEGILQAELYQDSRLLLDSIDLDTNEAGIQTSLMNAEAYKNAFDLLGLIQTGEDLETGEVTFNTDELHTWNVAAAGKSLTAVQAAQKEFSEDISQFDTGEIIGMVDEGINAKSLDSQERLLSKKTIDYYFGANLPKLDEYKESPHIKYHTNEKGGIIKDNNGNPILRDSEEIKYLYENEKAVYFNAMHLKNQFLEGDTAADLAINDEMIKYRSDLYEKGVTAFETREAQEALKNDAINRINVAFSNMDGIKQIDEKSQELSPSMAIDAKRVLLKDLLNNVDFPSETKFPEWTGLGADDTSYIPKLQELKDAFDGNKNTDRIMKQLADEFLGLDGNSELKRDIVEKLFEGDELFGDASENRGKFYEILRAFHSIDKVYPSSTDDSFAQ